MNKPIEDMPSKFDGTGTGVATLTCRFLNSIKLKFLEVIKYCEYLPLILEDNDSPIQG
jgi:hypothetical protein